MLECSLSRLLTAAEGACVEFKEAKNSFGKKVLFEYCAALANEGGGCLVLGVSDTIPRTVVGTRVFSDRNEIELAIRNKLHLHVRIEEVLHPDGRVLIFSIPSRPLGHAVECDGSYLMRCGQSLVSMPSSRLKEIFAEDEPDYSATYCPQATLSDLDSSAINDFRSKWARKSNNPAILTASKEELLGDAELVFGEQITRAALILFGTPRALGRLMPQCEVIFEYRQRESDIAPVQRINSRAGFFLFHDQLWATINLRNALHSYQSGLVRRDIPAFREEVVREALLNAVCHRDYRRPESVFIRQGPDTIEVESPGGLPPGVNVENILFKSSWRNRRIAEAFEKVGLVERSGQGVDRMWQESIKDGKLPPDYTRTDKHQVVLMLHGAIADPAIPRFLEVLGQEHYAQFSAKDFAILHYVSRSAPIPASLKAHADRLRELGAIERHGRKHILSRKFYSLSGQPGVYTRKRGLDRDANKELLFKHAERKGDQGSILAEFRQVLPNLPDRSLQQLLKELKDAGRLRVEGRTRGARWFLA